MKRVLALGALLALTLAASAHSGGSKAAGTVSSSRLVDNGHIRVTATVRTPVQIGHVLDVTYRIRNLSKVTRKVRVAFPWYVVQGKDGTTYDTRTLLRGAFLPYVPPTKLRPGQTVTTSGYRVRVRWAGPLRVTPGWGTNRALPTVSVGVKASGAPSRRAALAAVLAETGHLLDRCTPTRSGVAVTGTVDAPKHSAPSLHARCSISLHREQGFFRAQVLVISPSRLRVHVQNPYELLLAHFAPGQNATAVAWLFVVTGHRAISVDSTSVASSRNVRESAPGWQWTTSGFQPKPGGTRCGGTGGGGGGSVGPYIEFVSNCR